MIALTSTTQKLQAVLAGAVASTNPVAVVFYSDLSTSGVPTPGLQRTALNGVTAVDILVSPLSSGVQRVVKSIFIENADTATISLTIQGWDTGPVLTTLNTVSLLQGDNLQYVDKNGFSVVDSLGNWRTGGPATGALNGAPRIFTSGTSFTTRAGTGMLRYWLQGAGAGSGGVTNTAANAAFAAGGSAGGVGMGTLTVAGNTSYAIAIGAGGTAGANTGGSGGTAGATTLTANGTVYSSGTSAGGNGMTAGITVATTNSGLGGTPTNCDIGVRGAPGMPGIRLSGTQGVSGNGGSSIFGGGGIGANTDNTVGSTGGNYGGGAGGASTLGGGAQTGGVGGPGVIIIEEYYA